MPSPEPLLVARQLAVGVAERVLCRELDLSIASGECLAVLGRNGVGKSTLLAVLAGLRRPLAGQVLIGGQSYADSGPRSSALLRGWLAQRRSDAFSSTVLETALIGRHPHLARWDWESASDAEAAFQALLAVGLADLAQRDVQTLSSGERQRLAIATLLTQAPQLYLLDEPLAHLDLNHQIAVLEIFARLTREQGAACVMVLHEPGLAVRFCTRALLLFADGAVAQGGCDEVISSESLTRLYGYPLCETGSGRKRWFMPA